MSKVKLHRVCNGLYEAWVSPKGCSAPVFILTVVGPDPSYPEESGPGYRWCVDTDDERYFHTLADARKYVNKFFDHAEEPKE